MAATKNSKLFVLLTILTCLIQLILTISGEIVKELTDEIGPWKQKDEAWLVMFHAPWCGHCRQLSPTYHRVGQELMTSQINVGKLDCTVYGHLAGQYEVRGFPTVKYIYGDSNFTHRGDRSKEAIVEFTRRAHGPAVRGLDNYSMFVSARGIHGDGVFFMYVGELGPNQALLDKYAEVAEKFRIFTYFYKGEPKVLPKDIKMESPSIVVFKDKSYRVYKPAAVTESTDKDKKSDTESTPDPGFQHLSAWVNGERFPAFPHVEGADLNEMSDLDKFIFLVTVDGAKTKNNVKDLVESVAMTKQDKYHAKFQFAWMSSNDAVDSMTMSSMPYPFVLVLDPHTQLYYLPDGQIDSLTMVKLEQFLHDVERGKVQAYGGTGVLQRIKRVFYDLLTSIYSVWVQSRLLFFVMFGVPTMLISVVCYGLCCMDTADDDYERIQDDENSSDANTDTDPPPPLPSAPIKTQEEKKTD